MLKVKFIIPVLIVLNLLIATCSKSQVINTTGLEISLVSSDSDKSPQSKLFTLYQNEATESIDVTVIKFELKIEANVILNVTDINGNVYETLVDGEMQPGTFSVLFKSTDNTPLKNMFYTIQVNGFKESRNMNVR